MELMLVGYIVYSSNGDSELLLFLFSLFASVLSLPKGFPFYRKTAICNQLCCSHHFLLDKSLCFIVKRERERAGIVGYLHQRERELGL